ncbi:MAG: 2-polyprenylphenol 6-hydroxylase [Hyphomicrobiales bacterium]|nr:2-polyprenylphenol 6-hydroxylase [Hyphomicrobiales bacterium]
MVSPLGFWRILRLGRAGFIMAREGVFLDIDPAIAPPALQPFFPLLTRLAKKGARNRADALAAAMTRLGPSYVKLGQFLATRPDVVGMRAARGLEALQDRMPPFPREEAIRIVEAAFGAPLAQTFATFGEPVAAASIAQVHRATVKDEDGERAVAVKIMRPGIERRFRRDLADMAYAAQLAERNSAEARRLRLGEVVETVARSVKLEMDFRLEAAAASEFAQNVGADDEFRVPQVDWVRTARDVLTSEWIDGVPLSDIAALRAAGFDLPKLGREVIQSFLRHAVRDGFFHADMHPGNLFADRNGKVTAVDFGIMGRLGPAEQRFLAEILYGFITKDYMRVARVHFEAGYVPKTQNVAEFAQAIRAIGEPIHSRTADQISMAKLLTLLFEITGLFDMRTRTELVLLQKTMVVVEGVGRSLDPQLNMWKTAEPVLADWIADNLGPAGKMRDAGDALGNLARALQRAPQMMDRLEALVENMNAAQMQGVTLSPETVAALQNAQTRANRWTGWPLWLAAALAVYMLLR